jgi:hypothetical protein
MMVEVGTGGGNVASARFSEEVIKVGFDKVVAEVLFVEVVTARPAGRL